MLIHSTHTWLPLTEKWIYLQVKNMPEMSQMVLCDRMDKAFPTIVPTVCNTISPYSFKSRWRRWTHQADLFRQQQLEPYPDNILLSHYGVQGYHDLGLKTSKHITRFYGYDLTRTIRNDSRWVSRYQKLFKECDQFLVEGPHMATLLQHLGCPENRISISLLGCEPNFIPFEPRTSNDEFHVLIACATAERKGIIYALKALSCIIHEHQIPVRIHWVGGRTSDYEPYVAYEKELEIYIVKNQLEAYIQRYGFLPAPELYRVALRCQVALHPSVWAMDGDCEGGYPVVLTELMATGLPVISTIHCDIPEVVKSDHGYLCEEKDVNALVDALLDCHQNKTYIAKSIRARKYMELRFDWSIIGKELQNIITG